MKPACACWIVFLLTACCALAQGPPVNIDGIWLGALEVPGAKLRVQIVIKSENGKPSCALDSLDQGAMGLPCDNVKLEGAQFSFDVPLVHGHWSGALSSDGNSLTGTWSQGGPSLPLQFTRQAAALAAEKPKPPKFDDAMAPIAPANLKAVLDKDMAGALPTEGAMVVGIIHNGNRQVFHYGTAADNSIFEIGSISKTFTGLILAQMVQQGKVKLDEPVRDLLPKGVVPKPDGAEITLIDLATQRSGLPRMPDNFHPANLQDPYADYAPANLYEFVGKHGVAKPAKPDFLYSNLGFGLLGQALSNSAGLTYPQLLKAEVTDSLGMNDTTVKLSPDQQSRFIQGYDGQHNPAHAWALDAVAGAGAIRSTAGDMLTYLQAQLHPAQTPLAKAIEATHELRADALPDMKIGLAWLCETKTGNYWHNGATGGYSSYAFFNPKEDYAAIVLFNATVGPKGSFADRVGEHIVERLTGKPAISLNQ